MRLLLLSFVLAKTAFGGMTVGGARWSTNSVEVCFAAKDQARSSRFGEDSKTFPTHPSRVRLKNPTDSERALIESTIRGEYRLDSTGFEFTGFSECTPETKAKIFIYVGQGGPLGAGNIGENMKIDKFWTYRDEEGRQIVSPVYVKLSTALPGYLYFQNLKSLSGERSALTPKERLSLTALHEFGHAAGLLHEDERPETNRNPNCEFMNAQSMFRVSQPIPLTPYDPASIMSYCFIDFLKNKTGLRYQVARPGVDPSTLAPSGLPILAWPGLFFEDSSRILRTVDFVDRSEFTIHLGLSEKDRRSIRCIYSPSSACHSL
jgi:hypothetical protein